MGAIALIFGSSVLGFAAVAATSISRSSYSSSPYSRYRREIDDNELFGNPEMAKRYSDSEDGSSIFAAILGFGTIVVILCSIFFFVMICVKIWACAKLLDGINRVSSNTFKQINL